jgi:hypothetical protein
MGRSMPVHLDDGAVRPPADWEAAEPEAIAAGVAAAG